MTYIIRHEKYFSFFIKNKKKLEFQKLGTQSTKELLVKDYNSLSTTYKKKHWMVKKFLKNWKKDFKIGDGLSYEEGWNEN